MALALLAFAYVCAPYVDLAAIKGSTVPAPRPVAAFYLDAELLDPTRPLGYAPRTFAQSPPLQPHLQRAARTPGQADIATRQVAPAQQPIRTGSIPFPTPRPADIGWLHVQKPPLHAVMPSKTRDDPFEKLFGKRQTAPALAYAPSDGGIFDDGRGLSVPLPPNDGLTAIYDISARTVYLPDGTALEAHSGLGPRMDDPRYVHVRMHGATPPHVYDLAPREALFHGDEALRMHPVGGAEAIFGRTGLLTHSYLLGPNGQSNGCVSFKDYEAFLRAYKAGKVKRLVVVASLG
jgi:type VI secretion system (T6SS) effector TldE1-like protein